MYLPLPRILYIIAALGWTLLLWPNPVTIFLAACFSCLTLPVYRRLRLKAAIWRRKRENRYLKSRIGRFLLRLSHWFPVTVYACFIVGSILGPVALLIGLVSPQAMAGYAKFRELLENGLELPENLQAHWVTFKEWLQDIPFLAKAYNEAITNLESMATDFLGMLVTRSFGFVGSTMNLMWVSFLFLTLTILFTVHCRLLRKVACRVMHISSSLLNRFLIAIFKALKAIILGIALVALVQGALCGIGFAFAGVSQPAFWGMLATIVAPIPMVGTALVWAPLSISLWVGGKTMAAIGLALWGAIFISAVDNVLRPFFLKQGIKASFFVLILAILCGLSVFGAVGLIAGPIILAVAMQALEEANRYYKAIR